MSLAVIIASTILCGCGGGGKINASTSTDRSTQPQTQKRSVRLNNYNNWGLDDTSAATLQNGLIMLAKRDCVLSTERRERHNDVPGWDKLTPQSLRNINPNIKVYRYYSLMSKSYPDTDWANPQDLRRMMTPVSLGDIKTHDWWLRDGNGEIVKEGEVSWLLDVGKPGFKEAYLKGCLDRMRGKGFDGFVFDYWWPTINHWLKSSPRPANYPTDEDWFNKAWKPFINYVMDGLHQAGYKIIGNACGEFGTTNPREAFHRSKVDGTIYEQGAIDWAENGSGWLPGSVMEKRINAVTNDPLEVWVADAGLRDTVDDYDRKQTVSLAYYYIAIPADQSKRSYHHAYNWMPYWQPLWDLNIGVPAEPAQKQSGQFFWHRKYTQGIVLLNYEQNQKITYTLDSSYRDLAGKVYTGTVTLEPHSAMILSNASPDCYALEN